MLIGLVGLIGSGKGTVAKIFSESGCIEESFAAPLKDLVSVIFGWPRYLLEGDTVESREFRETPDLFWSRKIGIPNLTPRLALQLIGTDVMRKHFHDGIWCDSLEYRLLSKHETTNVVVSDARFRNELEMIKNMGGKIIWVQRGDLPEWWETAETANTGNAVAAKLMRTKYKDVHESEWNWAGFPVDYVVKNDSTIDILTQKVKNIQTCLTIPALKVV
jgi:dephospho-CoA kinase